MIYVSSSCVKAVRIADAVETLVDAGFRSIELSGGTEYYPELESDLLELKEKFNLSYLCHNYFPPPKEPFVVNLASLDDSIRTKSLAHLGENIRVSRLLGGDRISFHAGFFVDISTAEIGHELGAATLSGRQEAINRFCDNYQELVAVAGDLPVYVENNVYSQTNRKNFAEETPFMLLNYTDFLELKRKIDFHFLLDVGHLKVSCRTLGLDFSSQLEKLFPLASYLHVSDNDGLEDLHGPVQMGGDIYRALSSFDLSGKVISLEVGGDLSGLRNSYDLIGDLVNKSH